MRKRRRNKGKAPKTVSWSVKRNSIFLVVGAALGAVLLSGYFLDNNSRDRGRVLRAQGSVIIERSQEKITPVAGTVLNPQDKIITGADSFVEVTYDDAHKDVLRISGDSKVVMESAGIEKQTRIFMYKGEIVLKLENLEKGSTFKIRTPTAIAGVRGTSFAVQLKDEGKEAVITDYESRIFVKGLTEDFLEMRDELLLSDGWRVRVKQFEKPSRVEKITPQEFAAWQAWLDEIASLPKDDAAGSGLSRLTSYGQAVCGQHSAISARLINKAASSVSVLAFLLYVALATNIGRVFLWQANPNKTNT